MITKQLPFMKSQQSQKVISTIKIDQAGLGRINERNHYAITKNSELKNS